MYNNHILFSLCGVVMTAYYVANANHKFDLVNVSHTNDTIVYRLFKLDNQATGTEIPFEGLENNITEYSSGSVLTYNGNKYRLIHYRSLNYSNGQLQCGGTYVVVTNDQFEYVIRVDSDKYPDINVSDWKYMRTRSLRPIFKFTITQNQQSWETINKVGYLNNDEQSTVFLTGDMFDSTIHNSDDEVTTLPSFDIETKLIPTLTSCCNTCLCQITISSGANVNGLVRFVNKDNVNIVDTVQIINGKCCMYGTKTFADLTGSADVLYGFAKVASLTL